MTLTIIMNGFYIIRIVNIKKNFRLVCLQMFLRLNVISKLQKSSIQNSLQSVLLDVKTPNTESMAQTSMLLSPVCVVLLFTGQQRKRSVSSAVGTGST